MAKRAYSPRQVLQKTFKTLKWEDPWKHAFGTPEENSTWLIHGPSAAGKSSFVMQLAKELCKIGTVLFESYEEGLSQSFQRRLECFEMTQMQGRFRVSEGDTAEEIAERLRRPKSPKFVIIDSVQQSNMTYPEIIGLIEAFPRKGFILISQEEEGKSRPMGKTAMRLKYYAGVKVRVAGYKAYCQGRFTPEAGAYFPVWEEGILRTSNDIEQTTN